MKNGSRITPWMDIALCVIAVAFMLGGVVMIFTGVSTSIAFALIAVGIALTVIVEAHRHRRHPTASH